MVQWRVSVGRRVTMSGSIERLSPAAFVLAESS
jgi:hypothetical protein